MGRQPVYGVRTQAWVGSGCGMRASAASSVTDSEAAAGGRPGRALEFE